jgi:tRNA (guanine37-N1)-methyltransferase
MNISVITLFPQMFAAVTEYGMPSRAVARGILNIGLFNPRDYTVDRHRTVDDRPYGGGPGMLMKVAPLEAALDAAGGDARVVYLSPQGRQLDHAVLCELLCYPHLALLCGRYEGVDERLIASRVDEELSLGDFVLSGGELAAMALIDALARLRPGVLGHQQSAQQDSFAEGLLDCPHYTRPESLDGKRVPDVLLSGDHERIRRWRLKQSLGRTWQRRPDLLQVLQLEDEQQALLAEYIRELADDGCELADDD